MKIVDLNILLYAVDQTSHHHTQIREWLESALSNEEPIGFTWLVIIGFWRVSTRPGAFQHPLTPNAAEKILDAWLAQPNVRIVSETPEHWGQLRELIRQSGTAGNLTSDAHLAAIAISNGATLVSCDADFSRFKHLRWENPLTA